MLSTIYRFTPPTCTLEITGQKSPLSRWTANDALKQVRFKLRFDDPRQATSKQVTIKGSEAELTQLQTALDRYVQNQLHSSFQPESSTASSRATANLPYLRPLGLTNHELFFGSLTHDSDRTTIKLGTVQLFDLVTALEDYQAKIAVLPDIERAKSEQKVIPLWGKIAVAAIATASIATAATIFKPQTEQNIASDRSQPESTAVIPELNEITPPDAPDPNRQPANPKLGEPIASAKRLPPPPAVETPKPKPDIPDPADYPLDRVARQSGLESAAKQPESALRSTPAETEILAESSSENLLEAIPQNINSQEIEADINSESNVPAEDEIQAEPELTAKSSSTQPDQTQEVITYFENNWQPPEDLQQSLEYRLFITPDGSLQRVIPLGKAARLYLSQTKIPVNGEPFITPVSDSERATIRLLLNPDGKVQAFTE